jgi:hypothetical protein
MKGHYKLPAADGRGLVAVKDVLRVPKPIMKHSIR